MIKCAKVKAMLSSFIDGELNDNMKFEIEAHLAHCPDCETELKMLIADTELLRAVIAPEISPYFLTKAVARIREIKREREPVWVGRFVWQAGAAALVLLGIGLGVLLGSNLAQSNGVSQEIATLNAEPSIEELFALTSGDK